MTQRFERFTGARFRWMFRGWAALLGVALLALAPGAQAKDRWQQADPFKTAPNKHYTESRPKIANHGARGSVKFQTTRLPRKKGLRSRSGYADSVAAVNAGRRHGKDGSDNLLKGSAAKGAGRSVKTTKPGGGESLHGLGKSPSWGVKGNGSNLTLGRSAKGSGGGVPSQKGFALNKHPSQGLAAVRLPKTARNNPGLGPRSRKTPL